MDTVSKGQRVKYVHEDAYPGYKKPQELEIGRTYTVADVGERPRDHKLAGDIIVELEELPGSVYSLKRFEPSNTKASGGVKF